MVTKERIREWLNRKDNHAYMLVVCDTFSYEDYPVYVEQGKNIQEVIQKYSGNMQRVMEVYNLSKNLEMQLNELRCWNI